MGVCYAKKKVMITQNSLLKGNNPLTKIIQTKEVILEFALTEPGEDSNQNSNSPQKRRLNNFLTNQPLILSINSQQFKFIFSSRYQHEELRLNEKQQIRHLESGVLYDLEVLEDNTENRKLIQKFFSSQVHQNYFQIIDICLENQLLLVVRQCYQGIKLSQQLLENQSNNKNFQFIINQIMKIIKTLHNLDIVHYNLSLDTFLIDIQQQLIYLDKLSEIQSYSEINYQYISPEQINYIPYFSKECNIWSFGMIVCEILNLKNIPQYKNNLNKFKTKISKWNLQNSLKKSIELEYKIILIQSLEKDPNNRYI